MTSDDSEWMEGASASLVFRAGVFPHSDCHTEEVLGPSNGGQTGSEATTTPWELGRHPDAALRSGLHPPGVVETEALRRRYDGLEQWELRMLHKICPLGKSRVTCKLGEGHSLY